jgi:hypothetical protein
MQQWYLSKTRLIGLVAVEATAEETRAGVWGRVRLGMGRELQPDGPQSWKYGRLRVKIHEHNYAQIATHPSETFYLDKPASYRSTEIALVDPLSVKAGQKDAKYPKGTRYWFLVEIFPDSSPPAQQIARIEDGSAVGFTLRESDRQVVVLHNATDSPARCHLPLPSTATAITIYEDNSGKGRALGDRATTVELAPQRHLMAVAKVQAASG